MAIKKSHIIFGAVALANLAVTAAIAAKMFLPTREELTDRAVEEAGWPDAPIGFGETPDDEYEEVRDYADEFDGRVEPIEREKKDPIDEGIDNILRFEVNGMTGFEQM